MKKLILSMCILFALSSCQNNDDITPSNDPQGVNSSLTLASGLRISELIEEGQNKTSLYSPFLFTFNSDGSVSAVSSNQTIRGTYRIVPDDDGPELQMDFPDGSALYELSDDWYFLTQDNNKIRFEDSGDVLEFQFQ
ncbi:MAG: hypothetical protein P8O16_18030 [Algoriphagus sp.]|uniref:hypothetical protein n=1 Tax=Algoriphagus sp. TaxID=1872435 RepID=UPI0026330295|nr:hypothetical protein [Algoriphagus sp.]MDG1279182.1 hypothetical protein [Algoriphagus sp.]